MQFLSIFTKKEKMFLGSVAALLTILLIVVLGYIWLKVNEISRIEPLLIGQSPQFAVEWKEVRSEQDGLSFRYPVWPGLELQTAPTRWELQNSAGTVIAVDISAKGVTELAADEQFKGLSFQPYALNNYPAWKTEIKDVGMDREWYILEREGGDYVWVTAVYEHFQNVEQPKEIVKRLLNSVNQL